MKKVLLMGIGIVGMSLAVAQAEEKAAAPAAPETPKIEKKHHEVELKDVTVVGTIQKKEISGKEGKTRTVFELVGENGVTYKLRAGKKDSPAGNLAELVGTKVKVVGKAEEGKHGASIPVITSLEKVAPAAAPVAPAAPAAK